MPSRVLAPPQPVDLGLTCGMLQRGPHDPTTRVRPGEVWRATRTPDGPATLHLRMAGGRIEAEAWGRGARAVLDAVDGLLGLHDDPRAFEPAHPVLRRMHRRCTGLRLGRTGAVMEALVPSILEQKVTSLEAHRAFARLVRRYGEPAPGPGGLMLQPPPEQIAAMPYYAFHPLGVERKRADTVRRVCARAGRMQEAVSMPFEQAHARLRAIEGVGVWTAAEVARDALGDPDAVSVGDFHLKNLVTFALTGAPRGTDEQMLELLEPYRGQRARAVRLIELCGLRPPRFGPRIKLRALERI